jgi:beta-lactamase regulating signal transducer with metallopeptidase domain
MSPEVIRSLGWDLICGSANAAVLGFLVLGLRRLLRQHLSPDCRLILGGLVLARLVWPWEIPSPVSLFNVTAPLLPPISAGSFPIDGWLACLAVWAAGVGIRCIGLISDWKRLQQRISRSQPAPSVVVNLWDEAVRGEAEFLRRVSIRQSRDVGGVCLAGLIQPCLLVPQDLGEQFSQKEIRLIFLHEIAHLRRRDLWLNVLLETVRTVHWFNPVVGWVLRRWREDREEACDVHALSADRGVSKVLYGQVLLKCLESAADLKADRVGVAWQGDPSAAPPSLVHRIQAIARFRTGRRTWVVGACTLMAVALLGLTDQEPLPPRRVWLLKTESILGLLPPLAGLPTV